MRWIKAAFAQAVIAALLVGPFASCTKLHIDVAVYKGPVADSNVDRISRAAGLASANDAIARDLAESRDSNGLLKDLVAAYPQLCQDISTNGAERSPLLRYAHHCQALARKLGYAELLKTGAPLTLNMDYLTALVTIDENARLIDALVGSAHFDEKGDRHKPNNQDVFLARIHHVMSAQSPGSLMIAVKESSPLSARRIERVYDSLYWGELNPIKVFGTGDMMGVLVRDEIGNWHLRHVKVDPERIAETATILGDIAVRLLPAL